ncbi:MAG: ABC transporter permease [Actinomycetia bacterium]|nr:ABC transporter permease [Actinomycetes bacterium]
MSDLLQTYLIARREFLERAKSRIFRVTIVVLALVIVGGIFALSFLVGRSSSASYGVGGTSPPGLVADINAAAGALETEIIVVEYTSATSATAAVESGEVKAALVNGSTIVSVSSPSGTTVAILSSAANAAARRQSAESLGLDDADVVSIVAPVTVTVDELEPDDPDRAAKGVASFLGAVVLLTTIMMFGQFVAMGIVEEKQNRVVEVVLARVKTTSLLLGKVLGIGALGLVQVGSIAIAVVAGLVLAPLPDLGVPDLTKIGVSAMVWLVLWFILGYLVYSFLYATLGATISRQEDMQSIAFIPAMAILPAYFLISFAAETGSNTLVKIASFVPLWSPIVMPFRLNIGDAQLWEVALAIVLAVITIIVLLFVGARVYRGAALRSGSRVSLLDAWRSGSESRQQTTDG